jgi:CheY-like chemotaxis protein
MNKKILVIDDDNDIRETLKEALEFEDYQVEVAVNGADAIDVLTKMNELPGLIILDLMMPIMDGAKFMEVIHTEHPSSFAKIPLVLASAKGSLINLENGHLAQERLKKPVDLDELYAVVKKYCNP